MWVGTVTNSTTMSKGTRAHALCALGAKVNKPMRCADSNCWQCVKRQNGHAIEGHDGAHNEPTSMQRVDKAYSSKIQKSYTRREHHTTKRNRTTLTMGYATVREAMKTLYGEQKLEDTVSTDIASQFVHVRYKMEPAQLHYRQRTKQTYYDNSG